MIFIVLMLTLNKLLLISHSPEPQQHKFLQALLFLQATELSCRFEMEYRVLLFHSLHPPMLAQICSIALQ